MSEHDELMLRVAALKVISEFTAERYSEARGEAARVLGPGDRRMVRSPLDPSIKVGAVYMTDPKPRCEITDRAALLDWLLRNYPDCVETRYEVVGSEDAVAAVLFEHAPALLGERTSIKQDTLNRLRHDAVATGQPVGPGGEVDIPGLSVTVPDGVVTCKPDDGGLLAVMELLGKEHIAVDGTLRAELPAGGGPDAE